MRLACINMWHLLTVGRLTRNIKYIETGGREWKEWN